MVAAPTRARADALVWASSILSACLTSGYGVLFTVVGDYRTAYGISESAIGSIIGIGFIAGFASQILVAPLGDRGHARNLVLAGVALNAVGLILMGVGDDVLSLTTGRVVSGFAIGAANPAIRRIIVLADPENLGRNLGRLLSAGVFGFALGPAISAVLVGPFGLAAPFFVIAAVSVVILIVTLRMSAFGTESTGSPGTMGSTGAVDGGGRQRLALDLLRNRSFFGAVVLGGTAYLMIGAFDALWDVVHEDLGTNVWMANLGITLFAIPLVLFGSYGGKLAQSVGPFRTASTGLAIGAVFMISYGLLPNGTWIFAFMMGHALTDGLTFASSGVAVAMTVPAERQAGAQGVLGAAQALLAGTMAVATGVLYQGWGRAVAYTTAGTVMLILIVIGMSLAVDSWRRPRPS